MLPLSTLQTRYHILGISSARCFSTTDTFQASGVALSPLALPEFFTLCGRASASTAMLNAGEPNELLNVAKTTLQGNFSELDARDQRR